MTIHFDTSSTTTLLTGLSIPLLAMSIVIGIFSRTIARILQVDILRTRRDHHRHITRGPSEKNVISVFWFTITKEKVREEPYLRRPKEGIVDTLMIFPFEYKLLPSHHWHNNDNRYTFQVIAMLGHSHYNMSRYHPQRLEHPSCCYSSLSPITYGHGLSVDPYLVPVETRFHCRE